MKDSKKKYQKIEYSWMNIPPKLPSKIEEVIDKKKYDIHVKNEKKYIILKKPKEYEKMQKIADKENAELVVKS